MRNHDIIQQSNNGDSIWLYWKFSVCMDWGGREHLEKKYPNTPVYDKHGVRLKERASAS